MHFRPLVTFAERSPASRKLKKTREEAKIVRSAERAAQVKHLFDDLLSLRPASVHLGFLAKFGKGWTCLRNHGDP